MPAAGRKRSQPDFVNFAQVGILDLEHDDNLLLVERVPLHSGEGDFHLYELAIGGDTPAANSKHAVRELHDGIKRVDRVGAHDPAQPRKAGQVEIVGFVRSVRATGDVASPVHRSIRPSCSAARTGADPAPYSFTSSRSFVTTSGVKRMFSSVAAPACFGSRQSSLNNSGGRTAGAVCCIDETERAIPKTRSTTASNLKTRILMRGIYSNRYSARSRRNNAPVSSSVSR